nr:uncharacterized protein LOC113805563 isoform X1 [Penaeus vannamei]
MVSLPTNPRISLPLHRPSTLFPSKVFRGITLPPPFPTGVFQGRTPNVALASTPRPDGRACDRAPVSSAGNSDMCNYPTPIEHGVVIFPCTPFFLYNLVPEPVPGIRSISGAVSQCGGSVRRLKWRVFVCKWRWRMRAAQQKRQTPRP